MLQVLIIDDEPLAQDVLETHLSKIPDIKIVKKCNNAFEAGAALREHSIDLIFLDINMPQLTGIEFVKSLSKPPMVIFTTAHADHAIEGFELNAIDYLLKPVSFERLYKAVGKALEMSGLKKDSPAENAEEDTIFVKSDKKLVKVKYGDIIYIEGLKDYVIIRTETGRVITLQTMKSLEERLPLSLFKRIHRSYIVSINKITAIEGNMVEVIEKATVKHLPIGKNYRDELLEMIEKKKL